MNETVNEKVNEVVNEISKNEGLTTKQKVVVGGVIAGAIALGYVAKTVVNKVKKNFIALPFKNRVEEDLVQCDEEPKAPNMTEETETE